VVLETLPSYVATSTVTVTIEAKKKRQVTNIPSLLPSYVTMACNGDITSRYRSACSCLGVTPNVVTAETPVRTVTATVSTSSTLTVVTTVDQTATITNPPSTSTYVLVPPTLVSLPRLA